ncbi:MAG TPA: EF-hand domain-containing protein, partial [Planctomycetaceae bacterium]|nr:EF-hand domain-containing protein [Planctomycetaceae bacterium]
MTAACQLRRVALAVLCSAAWQSAPAAEGMLPLETSVKRLPTAVATQPAMNGPAPSRSATAPTTPGGKLPQYQFGHQQRRLPSAEELANPHKRFFLALPQARLLVEAIITIDGLPFQQVREQRIERILKDVADMESATASPVVDRLRRTMQTTGAAPTADEVRWLLANWVDGPTVLLLNDNFQRFRANQRPEFTILDRNRDGTVSADELQQAVQSFRECDLNRDDIVQFTEIATAAAVPRDSGGPPESGKLLTMPADRDAPPDLRLMIAFHTTNPEQSRIRLTAASEQHAEAVRHATVDPTGFALPLGGTIVHFVAVQQEPSDQIAIGAVIDGYPLLPALDPNDDGRFTLRELRGLFKSLSAFDGDRDGTLTLAETPVPIRVCFGLGPIVHRELAGIRSVYRPTTLPPTAGPEWFVRMDRNKDNDLT